MDPLEILPADDLLGDRRQLIRQDHHVVAVPPHAAAHVQQDLIEPGQHGGDLVGNHLCRVEVAGVQAQQDVVLRGVPEVELVRPGDVALRADAEQLALGRIEVAAAVELLGEDRVQGFGQPQPRALAVHGRILVAVGDPDVRDAGRAQGLADGRADPAAGDAVLDPEAANALVGVGQGEAAGGLRVREKRGVEVHAEPAGLGPVKPPREVLRPQFVALDALAVSLGVDRMEVQAVRAGNQAEGLIQVRPKLIRVSGLAGVVARGRQSAAGLSARALEAGYVVSLPAVQRYRDIGQPLDCLIAVHAELGILLSCSRVGLLDLFRIRHFILPVRRSGARQDGGRAS